MNDDEKWSDISNDISDVAKKIKSRIDEEDLVEDLKDTFKKGSSSRIESKFSYSENLFSTSNNNGIFILQYNADLTITRIK